MKTKHIYIPVLFLAMCVSCTAPFQVTTTIAEDGTATREIYASGHDLFPFVSTAGWEITQEDTVYVYYANEKTGLMHKASGNFSSVQDMASGTLVRPALAPLFNPQEHFRKQFRWFYTWYTYEATFPEIREKGEIPISSYLNEDEIKIWLQGDESFYQGMNGIEINHLLQDIESKFFRWANRNLLEVCLDIIQPYTRSVPVFSDQMSQLDHEEFFNWIFKTYLREQKIIDDKDLFSTQIVCDLLDLYFSVSGFSELYTNHKADIGNEEEVKLDALVEVFSFVLKFDVQLPGKIQYANTPYTEGNKAIWKIDAYRLLADNYRITAQSREPNPRAFAITILLLLAAIVTIVRFRR